MTPTVCAAILPYLLRNSGARFPISSITARNYQVRYMNLPGLDKPSQPLTALYGGLYAGDNWRPKSNLTIMAGLRFDVPVFDNTAYNNPNANGLTFRDENGHSWEFITHTYIREEMGAGLPRPAAATRRGACDEVHDEPTKHPACPEPAARRSPLQAQAWSADRRHRHRPAYC